MSPFLQQRKHKGKRFTASFCVLKNFPQMPYASMQMKDYSLVEESKCWLLKSSLIFFSLLLHWKGKNLTIQQITEEFKYYDKKITYFFQKTKTEQNSQLQNRTSHATAVVGKPILTTRLLRIFYLNSNSAKRTSKCLSESFIFSV